MTIFRRSVNLSLQGRYNFTSFRESYRFHDIFPTYFERICRVNTLIQEKGDVTGKLVLMGRQYDEVTV